MVPKIYDDDERDDDYVSNSQDQDEDEENKPSSSVSGSEGDSEVDDPMDLDGWSSDENGEEVTAMTLHEYHEDGQEAENKMQAEDGRESEGEESEKEGESDEEEDILVRLTFVDEEIEKEEDDQDALPEEIMGVSDPAIHCYSIMSRQLKEAAEDDDILEMAKVLYSRELGNQRSRFHRYKVAEEIVIEEFVNIIATTHPEVLKAIVDGSLPHQLLDRRSSVRKAVESLPLENGYPVIYINYIVDVNGNGPTRAEWLPICSDLLRYVKESPTAADNLWAHGIDTLLEPRANWSWVDNDAGLRRYLDLGRVGLNRRGRAAVRCFASNLETRCQASPEGPLYPPPSEIGYSLYVVDRLKAHHDHQGNYLLNLVEALLASRYGGYELLQAPIFLAWRNIQAWLAEILFSTLLPSYITEGMGYNHHPAGGSNASATKLTAKDWKEMRKLMAELVPNYKKRLVACRKARAKKAEMKRKQAQVEIDAGKKDLEEMEEKAQALESLLALQNEYLAHRSED